MGKENGLGARWGMRLKYKYCIKIDKQLQYIEQHKEL